MPADQSPTNVPQKDCPKCRSRRISCDRTVPKCRKCLSRNFECPGYGVYLRWGQGVASRGRLTGQEIPVVQDSPKPHEQCQNSDELALQNSLDVALPLMREPNSPFTGLTTQLLNHFNRGIAARLAWVDDLRNPWRSVILPLSHHSPTVLSSVLALASEDLAYKYPTDHPWARRLQTVSYYHRNSALSWLSRELGTLLQSSDAVACTNQSRCVLASALILYNLELLTAPAAQWRIHIQCARAIIQWKLQSARSAPSIDIADMFLFYEYYYTSVVSGLTTFDPTDELQEEIPTCGHNITVFSDFIRIIHTVTRAERSKYTSQPTSEILPISAVVLQIKAAKARMIQLGQIIEFQSPAARRDFESLVHMFYYATLIYSHRVLADTLSSEDCIRASRDTILHHVLPLSQSSTIAHDLVWPLFIAGSECRGDLAMQRIVEQAMGNIVQRSGSLDRNRVLSFLKTFWSMDLEHGTTWIQYARAKSINFSFLMIL